MIEITFQFLWLGGLRAALKESVDRLIQTKVQETGNQSRYYALPGTLAFPSFPRTMLQVSKYCRLVEYEAVWLATGGAPWLGAFSGLLPVLLKQPVLLHLPQFVSTQPDTQFRQPRS